MSEIMFFYENVRGRLTCVRQVRAWVQTIVETKHKQAGCINVIFCDNTYLLKLNKQYLKHDTYTDIITFDFVDGEIINGDIFISWEQTADNAKLFGVKHQEELRRVIIHGVLHLLGYKDKTAPEQQQMRREENKALTLFNSAFLPELTKHKEVR
ncbi:endoribonuclease YbeY [Bacteroidia bacterium]|nr:endoribonuclease YbeY [Bacteroidia bacterium]